MLKQVCTLLLLTSALVLASPGDHLKRGDQLPQIEELDQSGKVRSLQELKGPNGTLFVIFRSADW